MQRRGLAGPENNKEEKMQPLTFTFNSVVYDYFPSDQWLFWIIVIWIIAIDDDTQRERKRRHARQQRARSASPSTPKPPAP